MHLVFIVVEGDAVEKEYSSWIRGKYQASKRRFLELFSHSLDHIKELSLVSYMNLLILEASNACTALNQPYHFPVPTFEYLPQALLDIDSDMTGIINKFSEYLEYDDIRLHTMRATVRAIRRVITQTFDGPQSGVSEIRPKFVSHTFQLLQKIRMPVSGDDIGRFIGGAPIGAGWSATGSKRRRKRKAGKMGISPANDVTVLLVGFFMHIELIVIYCTATN
jgi:hypothetical protein